MFQGCTAAPIAQPSESYVYTTVACRVCSRIIYSHGEFGGRDRLRLRTWTGRSFGGSFGPGAVRATLTFRRSGPWTPLRMRRLQSLIELAHDGGQHKHLSFCCNESELDCTAASGQHACGPGIRRRSAATAEDSGVHQRALGSDSHSTSAHVNKSCSLCRQLRL